MAVAKYDSVLWSRYIYNLVIYVNKMNVKIYFISLKILLIHEINQNNTLILA
jgi:hypothetical protein